MPLTLLLVHGAWHGAWCWERVLPFLSRLGVTARTVDLPSVHDSERAPAVIAADAMAVRNLIETISGHVVLCGHSYGGMVITHPIAGNHPRVKRLIYLCAYMLDSGESPADFRNEPDRPNVIVDEKGMMMPDMNSVAERFFGDCDLELQQWAMQRLRAMPTPMDTMPGAAWHSVPSTYIVCTQDRAISVRLQREVFAPRARQVLEMATSHSPFLSQPGALAELLAANLQA